MRICHQVEGAVLIRIHAVGAALFKISVRPRLERGVRSDTYLTVLVARSGDLQRGRYPMKVGSIV